ncbi:hypothetical protein DS2_14909 [Catenovulum agarivorans DS-2]|uniref:Abasic site processing protein n=1 Tax=Catenovulum agarivorans DS-2 TaxID=1328313 RepID=W7Q844_9ALTE|nr:SOS response-associated peptidase family protein [Catenovulum agarivorans]EWH08984.1 hypothetical protein DS2_14909 [Catenovulum agarivorans DS-2]
MCGRLNVIDNPGVQAICDTLGINYQTLLFKRYIGAGQRASIVRQSDTRQTTNAIWWLLQQQTETGLKCSKYTSFNTRYDKLNVKNSAGYQAYRTSRCVVPVSGFGETEGKGKSARFHDMFAVDNEATLLTGLCRDWVDNTTGETITSFSVITKPPHPKLANIHSKSMPLLLPQTGHWLEMWLDPKFNDVEQFTPLLEPFLPQNLNVVQIDKPSAYNPVGERFLIAKD